MTDPSRAGHDAVVRLNDHHAAQLLDIAQVLGGHPKAVAARAVAIDNAGIDLAVDTPTGTFMVRVDFAEAMRGTSRRLAFRDLANRAANARRQHAPEGAT